MIKYFTQSIFLLCLTVLFSLNTHAQVVDRETYKGITYSKGEITHEFHLDEYIELKSKDGKSHIGEIIALSEEGFNLGHGLIPFADIQSIKFRSRKRRIASLAFLSSGVDIWFVAYFLAPIAIDSFNSFEDGLYAIIGTAIISGGLLTTGGILAINKRFDPSNGWIMELIKNETSTN